MFGDFRYALRRLRRSPLFAAAAVLTLALGIGANVAIFSLIDRVVLHPLNLPDAARLVMLERRIQSRAATLDAFLYDQYLTSRNATLASVGAFGRFGLLLVAYGNQTASQAPALFVSANYFTLLGIQPHVGRTFQADDDRDTAEPVAILSDRVWRTRLGADPTVVGRAVRVNGLPVTIVGVAPAGFNGTQLDRDPPELFLPIESARRLVKSPGNLWSSGVVNGFSPIAWLSIVGRLRDGATRAQAGAEIAGLLAGGGNVRGTSSMSLAPLEDKAIPLRSRDDLVRFTALLAGAVALTLFIACANLTSLLLARVEERRTELAVRAALGAGRWRVMRQLLVEAGVIAALGGAAALLVATWVDTALAAFQLPGGIAVSTLRSPIDPRALLFATALTAIAALLSGLGPALGARRRDLVDDLKRQSGASPKLLASRVLIAFQIAVCLVLVFGAGLFIRSLSNAIDTDLGFDSRALIVVSVNPLAGGYDPARGASYVDALFDRVKQLPGIDRLSMGPLPMAGGSSSTPVVRLDGVSTRLSPDPLPSPSDMMSDDFIGPDYFATLRQRFADGRDFNSSDDANGRLVAVVSESAARRFWPGQSALGHRIGFLPLTVDLEVIGVVRDVKRRGLTDSGGLAVYVPRRLASPFIRAQGLIVVRAPGTHDATIKGMYAAAAALDPNLPITRTTTVDERLGVLLMPQRLGRSLLGWLGVMALTVTIVGVYGLVACVVARSTREIGVRIALGADTGDILRHTIARAVAPVAIGVLAGSAAAWWAGRFADRFMYGIRGSDPTTIAGAALLLLVVASAAALVPARRALRIDPIQALRAE